ncbi:MAG TPA: MBL fold metallo-hydrolase [Saprospiraceae bacterium]|nr:MBL fold metallo-hydrolase [Saprospiraceae bacterium]
MMIKFSVLFLSVLFLTFTQTTEPPENQFILTEGSILNLYDAFGKDSILTKDFGFSCITKYQGKTILFDAGSNADIFKNNIIKLGIDLKSIDLVVISHGHFDHLNGLDYVLTQNPNVKIYFPYDIFWGAPVPFDATGQENSVKDSLPKHMQYFEGGPTKFFIKQSGRFWKANIEFVKSSKEILPGLNLIATSSSYMGYFSCYPNKSFVEGQFDHPKDECKQTGLPELSLSMKTPKGDVLIVGCSHTGVENIIIETQKFTNAPTDLVYGGFHLLPFDRIQTSKLVDKIKNELKVLRVAPAHCTGHLAFQLLQKEYATNYLYAGLGEKLIY